MTYMKGTTPWGNFAVAAGLALVWFTGPVAADPARLDQLFADLAVSDAEEAPYLEGEIRRIWSQSGSASADLLLSRAQNALEAGDYEAALGHSTALTDHAPGFAAGHGVRATALFNLGKTGPALAALEQALVLEPRDFDSLSGLGMILMDSGQHDKAREVFAHVVRLHPHLPAVSAALGQLNMLTRGIAL